ncbi:endo-1,4-beta-xylanase [Paenibacillus sp. HB172176]|uniref:endo-1,4-beta-xylanase n=1 Tax=Paenibacillus sp. HB172176 TaxID=2493690 RepID=UPI00143A2495|nr:endo-1,4-beta-xylanase [Paenibacillus sp. HB172176]
MSKLCSRKAMGFLLSICLILGGIIPGGAVLADEDPLPSYMQDLTPDQQQLLDDMLHLSSEPNPYTDDPDSVTLPTTGTLLADESDLFAGALSPQSPDSTYYNSEIVDVYDTVTGSVYYDSNGDPMPFGQAVEFETVQTPASTYNLQIMIPLAPQMEEGDVVLAMFYLRTISSTDETGAAMTQFVFERETPNLQHMKFLADGGVPTQGQESEWVKYYLPFEIQGSDIDGSVNSHSFINFRLGFKPQTIQIAGLEVYNYEQTATVDTLPRTVASYDGMNDADAEWRIDALERIEQIRKDDFSVVLKDKDGNLLKNANVNMELTKHDFKFGTAVSASRVTSNPNPGTSSYRYNDVLTNSGLFNSVIFETEMKWPKYEQNPQLAKNGAEWAKANDLYVRGHALVWDNYGRVPTDVSDLMKTDPMTTQTLEAIQDRVDNHITDQINDLKNEVPEWDVVNEPILNGAMRELLAPLYTEPDPAPTGYTFNPEYESLVRWFQTARNADSDASLYINDSITSGTMGAFSEFLNYMNATNTPYDGIGIQSHFPSTGADPLDYYNRLYELGNTYNKRVAITEYDLNSGDAEFSAKFMRDILLMTFSNPYVDEFNMWGFWDGSHWLNNAPLFYNDWTLKPSGQVYSDLVTNLWKTNKDGVTDDNGAYSFRGYKGMYEGTVQYEGEVGTFTVMLNDDSAATEEVTVDFDIPVYDMFTDDWDDFSKVSAMSDNWTIATSTPQNKGNDPRRASRSTQSEEYLVYHVDDMTSLSMKLYYNIAGDDIELYGSATDGNYQLLTADKSAPSNSGGAWNQVTYTVDAMPQGTNFLKIVVPANSHAYYTPQLGQLHIGYEVKRELLEDSLDDFSKISEKSGGWALTTSYPQYRDNDPSRITRTSQTEQYIIYHADNMKSLSMDTYYTYQGDNIELYASRTGCSDYEELDVIKSEPVNTGNNWKKLQYAAYDLPQGTNYLKIVVPANAYQAYTPQIGNVKIHHESRSGMLQDALDVFSNVCEKSGNWSITSSSPERKGGDTGRAVRTSQSEEYLIYHKEDMQTLDMKLYYSYQGDDVQLYASGTNGNYAEVIPTKSNPVSTGNTWYEVSYSVDSFPQGTNYLKIVVPANTHASYTPQIGELSIGYEAHGLFADKWNDFSLVDDKSGGWEISTSYPQYRDNDPSRVSRTSQTEQYIVYHVDHMKSLAMRLYYTYAGNDVKLYGGSTGEGDYTELTVQKSSPANTGNNWNKVDYTVDNLPSGTNYVKIVVPANGYQDYTPQLGDIEITY